MNRLSMRNVRRAFVVTGLASLAVLSGCATTAGSTPEQAVSQRAQERWDHLLKSQYAKAYAYLTPAERAVTSEENYVQRFGAGHIGQIHGRIGFFRRIERESHVLCRERLAIGKFGIVADGYCPSFAVFG